MIALIIPSPAISPLCWDNEAGPIFSQTLDINRGGDFKKQEAIFVPHVLTHSPALCLVVDKRFFSSTLYLGSVYHIKCCHWGGGTSLYPYT